MKSVKGFVPTVTVTINDKIESEEQYQTIYDAKKVVKELIKQHKLINYSGFWANAKSTVEVTTNF